MTLQQLKEILDKGGMIMNGDKKCWWADGTYHYYNGRDWHLPFDDLISYISDPSEWSEVKPESIDEMINRMICAPIEHRPKFAPRMIVIDFREWEAVQRELESLRSPHPFIKQILSLRNETVEDVFMWFDNLSEARKVVVLDTWLKLRDGFYF